MLVLTLICILVIPNLAFADEFTTQNGVKIYTLSLEQAIKMAKNDNPQLISLEVAQKSNKINVVDEKPVEDTLAANEYIGEADGFGGPVKVKVTMDGDKIAKIDVLSHGETAGVSDPAFSTVPAAIIAANSTSVDVAAGATVSSKAIMAAVENALSKVK